MAHEEQTNFVRDVKHNLPDFFKSKKILEVGSLNINGTVRDFFTDCDYIGIDLGEGPGVDLVCPGEKYDAPDNFFDVVCSLECFEHNPYWEETFLNMVRMCVPAGLVFFTCATTGRLEHGTSRTTPTDSPFTVQNGCEYYRNLTEQDFREKIDFESLFDRHYFFVNESSHDLYFYGILKNKNRIPDSIPVIGVPIVNGFKWIQRLVSSIDYPVDNLIIINNNGRGELTEELDNLCKINYYYIKNIKVCHLPANIGVSGAWNLIIKCYMNAPFWMIVNNDVSFTSGFLKSFIENAEDPDTGIVFANSSMSYDLFLLKDWVVQKVGLFDENCYPAYVEDVDYYIRCSNAGIKTVNAGLSYFHGDEENTYSTTGSQTWRIDPSLREKLDHSRLQNEYYMYHKWGSQWHDRTGAWGPNRETVTHDVPFNNQALKDLPLTYTFYDLNFVRGKHLGF